MKHAAVVVALLAGLVVGLTLGRLTAPSATESAASRTSPPPPTANDTEAELRELRRRLEELRREGKLQPSGGPHPDSEASAEALKALSEADRRDRAKSIFETFRRAFVDKEGPELLKALGSVDELDETMTAFFVERHRAGIENAELRNMNLLLIQLSGGPDASAFVVDFLRNPATPKAERDALLHHLSGTGIPEQRKLPLAGELATTVETLLASASPADRMGGAGLLGGNDSDDARVRLLRMAQSDADAGVRASAIASLGWTGDRAAYERLKSWKAEGAEKAALERALAQLKRRFPD